MATSLKICIACITLEQAKQEAEKLSLNHKDTPLYVIKSQGTFYVDDSDFTRNWEQILKTYENGVITNNHE